MLETVEGEDASSQNISARAHIVGNSRNPRASKIATAQRMPTANKKTVAKKSSARTSKKQVEEESEVDEEETSADVPDDVDDNDDEQDDGAGDADVAVFKVGNKVVNCAGLRGLVRQCHDNGTYCVHYTTDERTIIFRHVKSRR